VRVQISVRTVGSVAISVGNRRLGPSSGRLFALLLYLASRRDHVTSRRVAQDLLYPNSGNGKGSHSLRQLLYRLRQIGVPFDTDSDELSLSQSDVTVDWWRFAEDGEMGAADLEQLSHGLFPGYTPKESEVFREWFEAERAAISRRLTHRLIKVLPQFRAGGRWDLMDAAAKALLALDPLSEDGTLARAQVLALGGSKSAALRVLEDYSAELGNAQPNLQLAAAALRRRISERLPEGLGRTLDDKLFIGREQAMHTLSAVGATTRSGIQQLLLVWGEPGIGKTRLLGEYRAFSELQGGLTLFLSCQSHDVFRPLGILSDLVIALLQAPGALGCDPAARRLLQQLVSTESKRDAGREALAAEIPIAAVVRSLDDLVNAVTNEISIVILLDDAQWIDKTSLDVLTSTFGARANRRVCVVMASRDRALLSEVRTNLEGVSSLRLKPLEPEAALELAHSLLATQREKVAEKIKPLVLEHAKGNPFFIRALCSHYLISPDPTSLANTIGELLKRRLDQLSSEGTRVLEACVVLGKNCTIGRLQRLLEFRRHELLRAVEELDDRGLLQISDECFIDTHALLNEVVVRRIAASVLRALHASAAEILEGERNFAYSGSLRWDAAEHWRLSGNDRQAIDSLRLCATNAVRIGRPGDAVATYLHALTLTAVDETRLDLIERALGHLQHVVDHKDAARLFVERKDIRTRLGLPYPVHDDLEVGEFGKDFYLGNEPTENIPRLKCCVTEADASSRHRLAAARQLLMIAEMTADRPLAEFAHESTRDLEPGVVWQAFTEMLFHTCFGHPNIARSLAAQVFEYKQDDRSILPYSLNSAFAEYRIGNWQVAEFRFLRSMRLALDAHVVVGQMHAAMGLARLYWSLGRLEDAKLWQDKFAMIFEDVGDAELVWEHNLLASRIALREKQSSKAQFHLEKARGSAFATLGVPALSLAACDIEFNMLTGCEPCDKTTLAQLLEGHRRARSIGLHDEIMYALASALRWYARETEAANLVDDYLRFHRRDSFSVDSRLLSPEQ